MMGCKELQQKNETRKQIFKNIWSWSLEAALSRGRQQGSSCALRVGGAARVRNITNANADINLPSCAFPWRPLILVQPPNLHLFCVPSRRRHATLPPGCGLKPLETRSPLRARAASPPQTGSLSSSPGRKTVTFKPSGDLLKQPRRVSPAAAEPDRSSARRIIGLISAGRP